MYLLSRRKGEPDNPWDMVQEMIKRGAYDSQVKVFMDEDRGVVTVSFIAMLMNGTGSESQPALRVVSDRTPTTENDFLVLRDGTSDNRWNLTFYAAPADYKENPSTPGTGGSEKSGGGRCDVLGLGAAALLSAAAVLRAGLRRKGR